MPVFLARANLVWLAGVFWLVFVAGSCVLALHGGGIALDTDAAMRLAELRDLLAGQSWFDTTQWRMDVPFGLPMHWSRLVNAPMAGIVLGLRPFIGPGAAQAAMLWIWPLIPFFAVLLALARIAQKLDGRASAIIVLFLGCTAVEILGLFAPGAIDHHNVQLALTLWMLVFLIEEKPCASAIACTVSLGVGLETLPYAVLAILANAFVWVRNAKPDLALRFGLALTAGALVLLFAATAARYRFTGACDTYSLFYALPLAVGGLGLAGLGTLALSAKNRALALAGLAIIVVGLAAMIEPRCLAGPYAQMDARLGPIFLSRINEARSALSFAHFAPSEFVAGYLYALAGLLASLGLVRTAARGWLVLAFAATAFAVSSVEIRGVPFAIAFALPGLAIFIRRFAASRGAVVLAAALLLASDASFALVGGMFEGGAHVAARIAAFEAQSGCGSRAGLAPLAALRWGRVAGFVDQGPAILAYTQDAAIGGPYHRDADGILDTYAIFTGTPQKAAAILRRRGIDYVMVCSAAPDWNFYRKASPDGLLARIAENRAPSWLVPAGRDASGHVRVYGIVRD